MTPPVLPRFSVAALLAGLAIAFAPAGPALRAAESGAGGETAPAAASAEPVNPYLRAARGKPAAGSTAKAKVYSNEDLVKLFGAPPEEPGAEGEAPDAESRGAESPGATPPPGAEEGPDPLTKLFDDQRRAQEHAAQVAAAETKVAEARQRIGDLEKRMLAVKNPLLARPAAPQDKAEEWKHSDGAERVKRTESELEQAQAALARAEAELEQLRRATP